MSTKFTRKATTGLLALVLTTGAGVGLATTASAAPAPGGAVATSASSQRVIQSPDGFANVRSGPGVGNSVLFRLNSGAKVTVLKTSGGWSYIQSSKGCGWVANWLLASGGGGGCKQSCPKPKPPQALCRVFVGRFDSADAARKAARRIGGGAFIVDNGNGTWSVQVGAFSVRANANARAAQFKNARVTGNC